jgi:flagellar motor switch protein FliM
VQVIRRKIGAAAAVPEGRGAAVAWTQALARGAREAAGLDLSCDPAEAAVVALTEVLEHLPDRGLIAVIEGPRAATGVIVLSAEFLAALVERQTLGRVTGRPVVPRRPTRTDAAMAQGMVDACLAALDEAMAEDADRVWAAGFRYASFLDDPRPLGLLLEDADFRLIRAEATLDGGVRRGLVLLALPAEGRGTAPPPGRNEAAGAAALVFSAGLAEQVKASHANLGAVLARVTLPLSQVMALAPGEVLRLGAAALDRIDIDGPDGVRVAGGRLGQSRGMCAIRLDPDAEMAARGPGALSPGLAMVEEGLRRTGTG